MNFKKLFLFPTILIVGFALSACCGGQSEGTCGAKADNESAAALSVTSVMQLDTSFLGQEITLYGDVEHVCKHSGRRCFISDSTGQKLRVEAAGEIEGFPNELIGHRIEVKGILREIRIAPEKIDEMEKKLAEKEKGEEEGHCDSERNNILQMRNWMKENGLDYYRLYFVEGISYETQEE